jgi:hypothetical protein
MTLSLKSKICLGLGAVLLGAAGFFAHYRVVNFANLDPELARLDRDVRALASATPANAADAARKLKMVNTLMLSPKKFEEWRTQLPPGWSLNLVGSPEQKSVWLQRVALSRPNALKSDWPNLARFLTDLSARPEFCLRSLSISTAAKSKTMHVLIVGSVPYQP